jgi:hypothetical protein
LRNYIIIGTAEKALVYPILILTIFDYVNGRHYLFSNGIAIVNFIVFILAIIALAKSHAVFYYKMCIYFNEIHFFIYTFTKIMILLTTCYIIDFWLMMILIGYKFDSVSSPDYKYNVVDGGVIFAILFIVFEIPLSVWLMIRFT